MPTFTARAVAAFEADGYVVDQERTAKDLEARGYKVVGIGRGGYPRERFPSYTVRALDADGKPGSDWLGLIEPLVIERPYTYMDGHQTTVQRRRGFTLRPKRRGSWMTRKPVGKYATTVAAAHALVDMIEATS